MAIKITYKYIFSKNKRISGMLSSKDISLDEALELFDSLMNNCIKKKCVFIGKLYIYNSNEHTWTKLYEIDSRGVD